MTTQPPTYKPDGSIELALDLGVAAGILQLYGYTILESETREHALSFKTYSERDRVYYHVTVGRYSATLQVAERIERLGHTFRVGDVVRQRQENDWLRALTLMLGSY